MFILINNIPVNILNIDTIKVVNHFNLLNNLSRENSNRILTGLLKEFNINKSIEDFKVIAFDLINAKLTFRIQIIFKDKSSLYSSGDNFYNEEDANYKMEQLLTLCNKVEASLFKINL